MRSILFSAVGLLAACGTSTPPKTVMPKARTGLKKAIAKVAKAEVVLALPAGWKKREDGTRMVIEGPEGKLQVVIVASAEPDLSKAIAMAWKDVRPSFGGVVEDVIKPPVTREPYSASLVTRYAVGRDRVLHQAIAHRYRALTYALLLRGPSSAVKKRAAQLREILGSVRPKDFKEKTLTAKDKTKLSAAQLAAIKAFAEQARQTLEVPGAQLALVEDGKVLSAAAFGWRDLKHKKAMTTKTHMMVGSITKSFTALLIAQLVARKKLAWSMPATELDKSFKLKRPEQTRSVQLQHLLCACTGVPRRDLPLLFEWEKQTPQKVLRGLERMEFLTKFGETFQYSNQLVAAAGFMVAKKLGRGHGLLARYAQLLKKHVLGPLGMNDSFVDMRRVLRKRRFATPHSENLRGEIMAVDVKNEGFAMPYAPAGALWSTADDFAKLLVALTSTPRGKGLPPEAQLAELWRSRAKIAAHATYGLGFSTTRYKGALCHGHGGGTLGFRSHFGYLPAARAGYVVLTNGSRGSALAALIARKIEAALFGQKDDTAERLQFVRQRIDRELALIRTKLGSGVPADKLKHLVGRYDGGELGMLRVVNDKGRALLDSGPLKLAFLPLKKGERAEMYMIVDPPLAGISFWVEHKAGKPELHFEPNSVHFVARKKR